MMTLPLPEKRPLLILAGILLLLTVSGEAQNQRRSSGSIRDFLSQYRGKEVQIIDRTGGVEQFTSGEATKTYVLTLEDVQSDFIIVTRDVVGDKRTFLYPISVIRRIIFQYDGKPYDHILLEMY